MDSRGEPAGALRRGLDILLALGAGDGALGVSRIAELVGREKSQISRALRVLADAGFVERDPDTRGYRLGWRLYALAARAGDRSLLELAPGFLRRLVDTFEECAYLSVLEGSEVLTVLSDSRPQAVEVAARVGRTVPVDCTAAGRALLFDHDPDALEALGSAGSAALWKQLAAERARGFALADGELEPGLVSVGAPVRDFRGRIVAALNISGPAFRFRERATVAGDAVKDAAGELSQRLGWRP